MKIKFQSRGLLAKVVVFCSITALCLLAILWVNSPPSEDDYEQQETVPVALRPVSVVKVSPRPAAASLQIFAEVVAEHQTTLRSQVNGAITKISPHLRAGIKVQEGEMLVTIEQSEYQAQVAEAKARLAMAKLDLLKEEHEAKEALINWQRSGLKGSPDSTLVLHQPQLENRNEEFNAATSILKRAEVALANTTIVAPFSGLILSRDVDPGESLFSGDQVAIIQSVEKFIVPLHLDAKQWAQLPEKWLGLKVSLVDPQTGNRWQAQTIRAGGSIDRSSRLRTLYLEVKHPYEQNPPLLPGTFVQAEISGRTIAGLLAIPESALTRKGTVWYVDNEQRLQFLRALPVFYKAGMVYIRPAKEIGTPLSICVSPNSGFLAGQKVKAITSNSKD